VALDLALQCAPDHPWVSAHPEWFTTRADGTIAYAENPPKKYQDIYPVNFDNDPTGICREVLRVVRLWMSHGVRIFRVDNPHTKPVAFWEWLLKEIRRTDPDVLFLAEAFTRPAMMRALGAIGFHQSYTYFTWRNAKWEIEDYLRELATETDHLMRPNFFVNTPDILHAYLQSGGPPAFHARLVLAATLGASYGIYSGFELFENTPVKPGSEEYLDSEKYQILPRDFARDNGLAPTIARINAIRRAHPALQFDRGLEFHETDNPQLVCYSKRAPDGSDPIIVVVNLDPKNMQHGHIKLPLDLWKVPAGTVIEAEDLLSGETYTWRDEWTYVRLDPQPAGDGGTTRVAHVIAVRPIADPLSTHQSLIDNRHSPLDARP
jgi:starch synthase (maltosyl-transferring)